MPPAWPRLHVPPYSTAAEIARINSLPDNELRFGDFYRLKSGRDRYSTKNLATLRELVGPEATAAIAAALVTDRAQAVGLRWILRGLTVAKAIRKVQTDQEVSRCAVEGPRTDAGVSATEYNRALEDFTAGRLPGQRIRRAAV